MPCTLTSAKRCIEVGSELLGHFVQHRGEAWMRQLRLQTLQTTAPVSDVLQTCELSWSSRVRDDFVLPASNRVLDRNVGNLDPEVGAQPVSFLRTPMKILESRRRASMKILGDASKRRAFGSRAAGACRVEASADRLHLRASGRGGEQEGCRGGRAHIGDAAAAFGEQTGH